MNKSKLEKIAIISLILSIVNTLLIVASFAFFQASEVTNLLDRTEIKRQIKDNYIRISCLESKDENSEICTKSKEFHIPLR